MGFADIHPTRFDGLNVEEPVLLDAHSDDKPRLTKFMLAIEEAMTR
jgi:hypothetical protein